MIRKVDDIELTKHNNGGDHLRWTYKGKEYWAQGEFHIDKEGYLHHEFLTPDTGEELDIKVMYQSND